MTDWDDELVRMGQHLEAQRQAIAGDGPVPPAYQPPEDLGPLPPELQLRAEALLVATQALEGEVAGLRNALGRSLRATGHRAPPPPAYLDERA